MNSSDTGLDAVGWQDIETAPKDGTPFLAYHSFTFHDGTPDQIMDVTAWEVRGGFWFNRTATNYYQRCAENALPTHWMPLPPPPGSAK